MSLMLFILLFFLLIFSLRKEKYFTLFIFLFLQSFKYLKYNLDYTWYFLCKKIACIIKFISSISLKKERK